MTLRNLMLITALTLGGAAAAAPSAEAREPKTCRIHRLKPPIFSGKFPAGHPGAAYEMEALVRTDKGEEYIEYTAVSGIFLRVAYHVLGIEPRSEGVPPHEEHYQGLANVSFRNEEGIMCAAAIRNWICEELDDPDSEIVTQDDIDAMDEAFFGRGEGILRETALCD